ncbi:E3 ubiquitin-protein ligase TRAIP-like [Notothenia coriiceps]|uniref:E3 ubiquitin-protein ligase TRAIP-like n=1 Tax=Notothenia coriiceps TaxID=8208 RepID=A0A6I9N2I0_9TELE|nr:PREDICTED: E3 ubiquitin-protein ligase TRAIP-like [Notothenia coriiceps]
MCCEKMLCFLGRRCLSPTRKVHRTARLETRMFLWTPFFKNSLLFRKKIFGSMLDPQRKPGVMRSGYDGLGGRTKFIQPSPLSEIRPLMKAKRKKVCRPPPKMATCLTLDGFLD